jgi:hypothetical protein
MMQSTGTHASHTHLCDAPPWSNTELSLLNLTRTRTNFYIHHKVAPPVLYWVTTHTLLVNNLNVLRRLLHTVVHAQRISENAVRILEYLFGHPRRRALRWLSLECIL